ncbi:MAG TPA: ABC-2 family transporter protein [Capillibacterium sp.]
MRRRYGVKKRIGHLANVLKATALSTYKEWAAYRNQMAVSVFVGPVFFLTQMFIWRAVYGTRTILNGLTLEEMLTYYGISAVIGYLTYDSADWDLQWLVRTGGFLTFLLRPVSYCFYAFAEKIGHRLLALLVEILPIYVIFFFVFRIKLIPAAPGWALLSLALSFILVFLTNYCIGLSAFWLTRTEGLRRAFLTLRDLSAGMLIPLTFFPEGMQKLLFYLPFQFITYAPIRVFIGHYELAGITLPIPQVVALQFLAVVLMFLLSRLLWYFGIKRFTGVGA